jgi:hypothetical protein
MVKLNCLHAVAKIEAAGARVLGAQSPHPTVRLDRDSLEAIATKLPQLVDAPTLATAFKVDAHTVYRNAEKLGGVKIGTALRFDPAVAIERARLEEAPAPKRGRRRRPVESDTPLLPIR